MRDFASRRGYLVMAAVVIALLCGAFWVYQLRHLSAGMRSVLTADLAGDTPAPNVERTLQSAQARVKTRRDRNELFKLQRALRLAAEADVAEAQVAARQQAAMVDLKQEIHSEQLMQTMQSLYISQHSEMSAKMGDDITEELERREKMRDARKAAIERDQLSCLEKRLEARGLKQQIRADLGLTAAP